MDTFTIGTVYLALAILFRLVELLVVIGYAILLLILGVLYLWREK